MSLEKLICCFFPKRCPLCGTVLYPKDDLCSSCEKSLSLLEPPLCPRCGLEKDCCACGLLNAFYLRRVAPFKYSGAIRDGMHRFKFQHKPAVARFYAEHMARCVRRELLDEGIDLVVCVPMLKSDYIARGYNQSALLAELLAKKLGIKADTRALCKLKRNKKQHELSVSQRRENVRGVFFASRKQTLKGKTVLLCDDVATTGCTLNECAMVLLKAGAERVFCVTAASVCNKRK